MAVSAISNQIRNGEIEVGLAVGFESMSATCVSVLFTSVRVK
jgi:acetyl-CoA acyltransferase 1